MSNRKLRISNTDISNLVSNLRGEVGEIIYSWILLRYLITEAKSLQSGDDDKDFENSRLAILNALVDKLNDEIIARLSELAEHKVGRLNFYFAQIKLGMLQTEVDNFSNYIEKHRFHEKRNYDISHKELPEQWADHKFINIKYATMIKGIVVALRLMKKIDRAFLGPNAKYQWREMRRRRYLLHDMPASVSYQLLPHIWLSSNRWC